MAGKKDGKKGVKASYHGRRRGGLKDKFRGGRKSVWVGGGVKSEERCSNGVLTQKIRSRGGGLHER